MHVYTGFSLMDKLHDLGTHALQAHMIPYFIICMAALLDRRCSAVLAQGERQGSGDLRLSAWR